MAHLIVDGILEERKNGLQENILSYAAWMLLSEDIKEDIKSILDLSQKLRSIPPGILVFTRVDGNPRIFPSLSRVAIPPSGLSRYIALTGPSL